MVSLASLYFRGGENLPANKERAWVYASLAVDASNNDPKAVKFRDEITSKLTDKQKSDAKKIYEDKKSKGSSVSTAAPASATAPERTPAKPETSSKKKK